MRAAVSGAAGRAVDGADGGGECGLHRRVPLAVCAQARGAGAALERLRGRAVLQPTPEAGDGVPVILQTAHPAERRSEICPAEGQPGRYQAEETKCGH